MGEVMDSYEELLEDYRQRLSKFDWQYDFSDDQRVYKEGREQQQLLYAEATVIGPEAIELYFEYVKKRVVS